MIIFFNQINGEIPSNCVIGQNTINPRDLCYQCSKDGSYFLSVKLRSRDFRDESCCTEKKYYCVKK